MLFILFGPRFAGKKTCMNALERKLKLKRVKHITTAGGYSHEYLKSVDGKLFNDKAFMPSITVIDGRDYAIEKDEVVKLKNKEVDRIYIAPTKADVKTITSYLPRDAYKIIHVYADEEEIELRMCKTILDKNIRKTIISEDKKLGMYDILKQADHCIVNKNYNFNSIESELTHICRTCRHNEENFFKKILKKKEGEKT